MNEYIISSDTATVKVTSKKGEFISIIDLEDFPRVKMFNWWVSRGKRPYLMADFPLIKSRNSRKISLHRLIMSFPEASVIDHVNGDSLDNRKINLRICCYSVNNRNRIFKNKFRGVIKRGENVYEAYTSIGRKYIYIGRFEREEMAAFAYNNYIISSGLTGYKLNPI